MKQAHNKGDNNNSISLDDYMALSLKPKHQWPVDQFIFGLG